MGFQWRLSCTLCANDAVSPSFVARFRVHDRSSALWTMEEKAKDIPSLLPLAPGGVYSVKWENRIKWGKQVEVEPVEYTPPFPVNPSNPLCFLVRPRLWHHPYSHLRRPPRAYRR
jgi:hypothetical protein